MTPEVSRITVYPVKGLSGVDVSSAEVTHGGALRNDRRFAMKDPVGKFINGKKNPRVFNLKATFGEEFESVQFSISGGEASEVFELAPKNDKLITWLSDYFSVPVTFVENHYSGYPDDTAAYGPTIVSDASYKVVALWFENINPEEIHGRFRANIVLTNCTPFWEDNLFGRQDEERAFTIGRVNFLGVNPCARCTVPPKNPSTGEEVSSFQKIFMEKRKELFPYGAEESRFDHYYRLAVNTKIPLSEAGKIISAGDKAVINLY